MLIKGKSFDTINTIYFNPDSIYFDIQSIWVEGIKNKKHIVKIGGIDLSKGLLGLESKGCTYHQWCKNTTIRKNQNYIKINFY